MSPNFFEGVPVSDEKEARRWNRLINLRENVVLPIHIFFRIMEDKFNGDFRTGRKHLNDAKLRHEEFLAVLALMFWTTGMAIVSSFYMSFTCTDQSGKRVREDKISSDALVSFQMDFLSLKSPRNTARRVEMQCWGSSTAIFGSFSGSSNSNCNDFFCAARFNCSIRCAFSLL